MEEMAEILVADDERMQLVTLSAVLEGAGYRVRTARSGEEAVRLHAERRADLLLLDAMMPRTDGFAACREIRAWDAETPILFLTALGDAHNELKGFGCGADDYIDKSTPERLILARVAAALRRASPRPPGTGFRLGGWLVHPPSFSMSRRTGETCALTDREIALLRLLATHPREALAREFLMAQCWGRDARAKDGALSVAISALREKLRDDGERIATVHGVGYAYRPKAGREER